jgi:hypothetical protein
MAYVGNLRQFPLGDVLRVIGDGQRRGRLVVERGGLRADIYCENGHVLHIWRSGPIPPLAQHWLNNQIITPEQLNQMGIIANMAPTTLSDAQVAQLAVDQGYVAPDKVYEWALNDAVDLLSILLTWRDGDYRFEEGLTPAPNRLRVPLPIATVLTRAVQRVGPWQSPQTLAPVTKDDILDFAELDPNDPQPVQLSQDQWRVLTLVDGVSPLAFVIQQMAAQAGVSPEIDLQRYSLEYRRAEEMVMRVAGELVSDGIAVVRGQAPQDVMAGSMEPDY